MPFLSLRNVSKGFGPPGSRTEVLHDIDLEVAEGEFLAVVGYSGAGKTSLISLIAGLLKADEGTIRKLYAASIGENAVHGSDSDENARIEGDFFFNKLEQF